MSLAEKASLANQYLRIFSNHFTFFGTLTFTIFSIGLILVMTVGILWFKKTRTKMRIIGSGMLVVGLIMFLAVGVIDTPQNHIPNKDGASSATTDRTIYVYHRRMMHCRNAAYQAYQKSQRLHNNQHVQIYEADKTYVHNHKRANKMKYYLKHHNPRAPWIDTKIL